MLDFNTGHRYGHGAQLFRIGARDVPGHWGLLYNTTTLLVHLPQEKVTIVLASKSTRVDLEWALAGKHGGPSLLAVVRGVARR